LYNLLYKMSNIENARMAVESKLAQLGYTHPTESNYGGAYSPYQSWNNETKDFVTNHRDAYAAYKQPEDVHEMQADINQRSQAFETAETMIEENTYNKLVQKITILLKKVCTIYPQPDVANATTKLITWTWPRGITISLEYNLDFIRVYLNNQLSKHITERDTSMRILAFLKQNQLVEM